MSCKKGPSASSGSGKAGEIGKAGETGKTDTLIEVHPKGMPLAQLQLTSHAQSWALYGKDANGLIIIETVSSSNGTWVLQNVDKIRISITNNPSKPYVDGDVIVISVLNNTGAIVNKLKLN